MDTEYTQNPFVVGRDVSGEYFCDRDSETEFLLKQINNGRNVALISPRRLGKTELINHVLALPEIQERYTTFFIDIYATTSFEEFLYLMGKTIFNSLKLKARQYLEAFFEIVKSLRAGFRIDKSSGEPVFEIGMSAISSPQTTLDEIFEYLNNSERPCIVALDEFQQIGNYSQSNVEALLRTKIQHSRASFIFAGSKSHLMANMFNSPGKPFYQSVITMGLEPIPMDVYTAFAQKMFELRNRSINAEVVAEVYNRFDGVTWFMQMLMNELFALTPDGGKCGVDKIDEAYRNVIKSQEMGYKELLSKMPPKQKALLQAIAKERTASSITSGSFIRKYSLPSASSVQSAAKALIENDIITKDGSNYRIYDYFFSEWLAEY